MKVSLIASSIRQQLYPAFFKSLENTSVDYEVVFAGPLPTDLIKGLIEIYRNLTYIKTANIKPAQCYEVARRSAKGDLVVWVADDCEFLGDVIGKAAKYWEAQDNEKLVLSLQTKEADAFVGRMQMCNMKHHAFFGGQPNTPLMAPLGMMSREYLDSLGGFDNRFVCGQYENDVVMRVYEDGGRGEIFGDRDTCVEIDHKKKHGGVRAFHNYYPQDRKVLEDAWVKDGRVMEKRISPFQGYLDQDINTKSQENYGEWE